MKYAVIAISGTQYQIEENQTITHWISNVDGRIIQWTERDIFDDEQMQITYSQIAGDLRKMEGSLTDLIHIPSSHDYTYKQEIITVLNRQTCL